MNHTDWGEFLAKFAASSYMVVFIGIPVAVAILDTIDKVRDVFNNGKHKLQNNRRCYGG